MRSVALFMLPFAWLAGVLPAHAQLPTVDISAVTTMSNQVEIRVRPDGPFNGFFAAMVFTLRWVEADGANLGTIEPEFPVLPYMSVSKSGPEQVSGPYRYQVFAGFGNQPLSAVGASWAANEEVVLCRVNIINGSNVFEIVNDAFTAQNNGDYYISLNGEDRTGVIYTFTTALSGLSALPGLSVQPNPTTGQAQVFLEEAGNGPVAIELFNASGQRVLDAVHPPDAGVLRTTLDLRGRAPGVYMLKVATTNGVGMLRVVLSE